MSIQILHFEPSLLDAQLTWLTLRQDDLHPEIDHVETFEEFEEALEDHHYDLVLCEFALHKRKTARDVIAYLKSKGIQVPVVVLSNITDNSVIADVLASGASDYLFKSHLHFLGAALRDVLNRAPVAPSQPSVSVPPPSAEFLKNIEAIKAQLMKLHSPDSAPASAPAPPLQTSSSASIDEMQKRIDDLTDAVTTLNANNFNLQNALEEARAEIQTLKQQSAPNERLEEARQALLQLADELRNAQERERLAANAYEEERQNAIRLKAELAEKDEREKTLMNELDKAQETEMQLRIELQDAVIAGNELRDAIASAETQLAQFENLFKQYEAALNAQLSNASALSEQAESAKAELASAQEEKRTLESTLAAAQESARALAERFGKELNELRAKLAEETQARARLSDELAEAKRALEQLESAPKGNPEKEAQLEARLAEAQNALSQLRADWEQANREVVRLENDLKIVEASFQEKSSRLLDLQQRFKAKEKELAEKSAMLNALNFAVAMVNPSGEICYWNEGAAVFHGVPAGEALGKKSDDVMKYKYASAKERQSALESLQSVGRWNGRIKYATPDGEQKIAEMFIARLDDEVGNPLGVLTILSDVTKRVAMEAEYQRFKALIEPTLAALPVAMFSFDDAGVITGVFGKTSDLQRLAPALAKGKSIYEIYGKHQTLLGAFRRVLSGESLEASVAIGEAAAEFRFSPIVKNGAIAGAVAMLLEAKRAIEQA